MLRLCYDRLSILRNKICNTGTNTMLPNSSYRSCRMSLEYLNITSTKPLRKKLVGRSLRSPLAGTWLRVWHFGHLMASPPPHVSYHPSKHFKQKLCKQERCLGSVNKSEHTKQDTSSRRLWNKVVRSMMSSTTSALWPLKQFTLNNEVLWSSMFIFFGISKENEPIKEPRCERLVIIFVVYDSQKAGAESFMHFR